MRVNQMGLTARKIDLDPHVPVDPPKPTTIFTASDSFCSTLHITQPLAINVQNMKTISDTNRCKTPRDMATRTASVVEQNGDKTRAFHWPIRQSPLTN
jgi:hypothetical protein